jgi:N-acetylmuramic acid 6-phosphate etherase
VEGAEDNEAAGRNDLAAYSITENDSVVGISVAGGAAYVCGGLAYGREVGALTISLTCNTPCKLERFADIHIHPDTGAEVVTGSTRMKAGSAHKMILNMISTAVMIRLGHVYENLMINLRPSNIKLRNRMISIAMDITGCDAQTAENLLDRGNWNLLTAIALYEEKR